MRYVIGNLTARRVNQRREISRDGVDGTIAMLSSHFAIQSDNQPDDRRVRRVATFDANPGDVLALKKELPPGVVIEPEILHFHEVIGPPELIRESITNVANISGVAKDLNIKLTSSLSSLEGIEVILVLRSGSSFKKIIEIADSAGECNFRYSEQYEPFTVIANPPHEYWSKVIRDISSDALQIELAPLPDDPNEYWWTLIGGMNNLPGSGNGIKVGVIDTGCGPHPCLGHVNNIGAIVAGNFDPANGADVHFHGTHVAGTIGAIRCHDRDYDGIATGVELFSMRVFDSSMVAAQPDIAYAIDHLSKVSEVDLINLSLGSGSPSVILEDAILDARDSGTLCISAAGNNASMVCYPAAFDAVIAVSAIGKMGWGPPDSLSGQRLPIESAQFGHERTYFANFSNFGAEINCAGPGVGIIAPVPERFGNAAPLAVLDGTSMSCPVVTALLARLLSADSSFSGITRDETRANRATDILRTNCKDLGLHYHHQGLGVPCLG